MGNVIASLFKRIFGKKQVRIVMVGLGYAGKTTILYRLKLGTVENTVPTIGLNVETVEHNNISFTVWDIGWGGGKISHLWRRYFQEIQDNTQVVIFVIDSSDRENCEEAKFELIRLLTYEELGDAVFLIFANKQDLPDAMTTAELTERLGLNSIHSRLWYIQPTCATTGAGLFEGLEWLADQLNPQYS